MSNRTGGCFLLNQSLFNCRRADKTLKSKLIWIKKKKNTIFLEYLKSIRVNTMAHCTNYKMVPDYGQEDKIILI